FPMPCMMYMHRPKRSGIKRLTLHLPGWTTSGGNGGIYGSTVSTVSRSIDFNGIPEGFAVDIWPQHIQKNQFSISRLPQQEIRYPQFARRTQKKIYIEYIWLAQRLAHRLIGNRFWAKRTVSYPAGNILHGIGDFCSSSIVNTHHKVGTAVMLGQLFGHLQFFNNRFPQPRFSTVPTHLHAPRI